MLLLTHNHLAQLVSSQRRVAALEAFGGPGGVGVRRVVRSRESVTDAEYPRAPPPTRGVGGWVGVGYLGYAGEN